MTDKEKTTHDIGFDVPACMAMMEKMMGDDCAEMLSQITGQAEIPDEWLKAMSQMMEIHCRPREETDKEAQEV